MFNKKSDYALNNNYKEAIVCQNAAGEIVRLTKDEFASEEEFLHWKEWSDDEYRQEYNAGQSYKRLQKKMQEQSLGEEYARSAEQVLLKGLNDVEQQAFVAKIKACLTEKQFRRLWLYYVEGLSLSKIADLDGTSRVSIYYSISAAKKKIIKNFSKLLNKMP